MISGSEDSAGSAISALEALAVLGDASGDALAPHTEAGWLELTSHVADDVCLAEAGALLDLIKAGAVMPCHADDGVALSGVEIFRLHDAGILLL